MRASDLIGCDVYDADGAQLGKVHDLRFEADGRPGTAAWRCRLTAVVCGRTAIGHRLGYGTGDMRGPWPLSVVFTHRRQRCQEIAWSDVAHFDRPRITLSTRSRQQSGSKR
jgi:hypothetical protein